MINDNKKRHIVICGKKGGGIAQVQSDWTQQDNTQPDYIKNKPNVDNMWFGTKAEYDLIAPKDPNTVYYIEGNYELENLNATANGTYQSSTKYGYDEVTVNVQPNLTTLNATSNDTYTPTSPVQGYSSVTVNVPAPQLTTLNTTINGTFTPSSPYVGYSSVTVNVSTPVEPFYVEDITGLSNTLTITRTDNSAPAIEVFKSTDGTNWSSMGTTDYGTPLTASIAPFGKLYLKATTNGWCNGDYRNTIDCTKYFNVGGNIMSLLVGDNFENATLTNSNVNCFKGLFQDTKVVDASKLVLPSNVVSGCYESMFMSTVYLTAAPATLPATTLAQECYRFMFYYCPNLMITPIIQATTLAESSCSQMFYDSNKVNYIITYAQDISASNCLDIWLQYVSGDGNFYNLGGATYQSGDSGIPGGWTEHTTL